MKTALRLNLGSGEHPQPGFVNVDAYVAADVVGDLFELVFEDAVEVRMSHVLEHISWRRTGELLSRVHGWMRQGGRFVVEVPEMDEILARGTKHPLWFKYVYGDQSHDGEYHRAGFTLASLGVALDDAGFHGVVLRRFPSTLERREGMPCIEAVAYA